MKGGVRETIFLEPIYVKSRWTHPDLNPRVANYPKMLKPQNVKPLKKDLGQVKAQPAATIIPEAEHHSETVLLVVEAKQFSSV